MFFQLFDVWLDIENNARTVIQIFEQVSIRELYLKNFILWLFSIALMWTMVGQERASIEFGQGIWKVADLSQQVATEDKKPSFEHLRLTMLDYGY